MQFYLDTADADEVRALRAIFPLRGVTTNPAILARAGKPFHTVVDELVEASAGELPLFFQVVGADCATMLREAEMLRQRVQSGLIIKVPVSVEGFKAMRVLQHWDTPFTATVIHSPLQALLAAEYGAAFVAPYVSRIDALQCDGVELVGQIVQALKLAGSPTRVLAASFRTPLQINQIALVGGQAVTVAPDMLRSLIAHPLTDASLAMFASQWAAQYPGSTALPDLPG